MTGTGKTVTRVDLCEAVYQKVGLSRTESSAFVELVLKEITDCLEKGETVKLSSFGSFMVRKKGQRIGRNPKTGTEVPISSRRVMVFKPSAILKQRLNGGTSASYSKDQSGNLAIFEGLTPALNAARTAFNLTGVRETAAASARLLGVLSDTGGFLPRRFSSVVTAACS